MGKEEKATKSFFYSFWTLWEMKTKQGNATKFQMFTDI